MTDQPNVADQGAAFSQALDVLVKTRTRGVDKDDVATLAGVVKKGLDVLSASVPFLPATGRAAALKMGLKRVNEMFETVPAFSGKEEASGADYKNLSVAVEQVQGGFAYLLQKETNYAKMSDFAHKFVKACEPNSTFDHSQSKAHFLEGKLVKAHGIFEGLSKDFKDLERLSAVRLDFSAGKSGDAR